MGNLSPNELETMINEGKIDTIQVAFPDMFGRLVGKRATATYFQKEVLQHGISVCDYLLGCDIDMEPVPGYEVTSWERGYGDFIAKPDLNTLRVLPWQEKSAIVLCDLFLENGDPVSVAPRQILQKQIERAKEKGFLAIGASELEFYTFKTNYEEAKKQHFHELETFGWYIEDYHLLQGTKQEWFIRQIRNGMNQAGIPIEGSKGEWGPGQHEINFRYTDFLEMSDRHVIYKQGVKEIAALNGLSITFMAKWNEKLAGSSCHMHSSLWDLERKNSKFYDANRENGFSEVFEHWMAGLIAHAHEMTFFYAPFINSYKRFQSSSFAPTRIVWSMDNRTAGFRVVGHKNSLRVENRMPGADANPYLAFAATLASGLDGIERRLTLQEAFSGNAYLDKSLPKVALSLPEAIKALEESEFARKALGESVVEHYLHTAHTEVETFNKVVTCWELKRHFERT